MSQMESATLRRAILHNRAGGLLALTGCYIAAVLTVGHLMQANLPCGTGSGCAIVASDPSSMFMGVPVAAIGFCAYLFLTASAILRSAIRSPRWLPIICLGVTALGAVISLYLTNYAVRALGVTCAWCLASALCMCLSFCVQLAIVRTDLGTDPLARRDWLGGAVSAGLVAVSVWLTAARTFKTQPVRFNLAAVSSTPDKMLASSDAHAFGRPDAPVTIVEFADLACPTCKMMHRSLTKFVQMRPRVRVVFHHFPLRTIKGHEHSYDAAILSERCGPTGFWDAVDDFFAIKGELTGEEFSGVQNQLKTLPVSAQQARMRVDRDIALANQLGIRQTPSYLILAPGSRAVATSMDLLAKLNEPKIGSYILGLK